jgi:hypothetical protein
VARDHDDGHVGPALGQPLAQLQSGHSTQLHVGDDDVDLALRQQIERRLRARRRRGCVPTALKGIDQDPAGVLVVVDDQHTPASSSIRLSTHVAQSNASRGDIGHYMFPSVPFEARRRSRRTGTGFC